MKRLTLAREPGVFAYAEGPLVSLGLPSPVWITRADSMADRCGVGHLRHDFRAASGRSSMAPQRSSTLLECILQPQPAICAWLIPQRHSNHLQSRMELNQE